MFYKNNLHRLWLAWALLSVALIVGCDSDRQQSRPNKTNLEKSKPVVGDKTTPAEPGSSKGNIMEKQPKENAAEKQPSAPDQPGVRVVLKTTKGEIVLELNSQAAPVTVKNFLLYVNEGFLNGTIFHRVIPNFMIQGGGFTADMKQKSTHTPIINEASNGLKNDRGTIAMARTNNPNSATSQFFINVKDNASLNYTGTRRPGYAVFGKVVQGMDVVDAIVSVKTTRDGSHSDVPMQPIIIESAYLADKP